ncbi:MULTISPECIES: sce7726 family protein [unclassified Rhizobium]|uniref:sce7726 family protein n=1 Tax=Rhizobium sp. BK313 TaxID=2587081 RepID=UPI001414D9A9
MKLNEEGLKCRLLAKFRRERTLRASSVVASEFVLGQTGCRSDLAIWNGSFIGIEVKSARDSLARLPDQMRAYRKFFDSVILLCDEAHLARAETLCPSGVGIYVWRNSELGLFRDAAINRDTDRRECVRSLSVKQLHSCLNLKEGGRYSRPQLEERVFADTSIDVRSLVVGAFEATYRTTTERFLREINGKRIAPDHLTHLSRFALSRAGLRHSHNARESFWRQWEQQAQAVFS